ncbi:MAG: DUF2380 domain-containing protein [Candidatus Marinimicrobia bacterium]|nr:DUF2380 domain-containing protein [Candidatus Neomarinimicrobiota bacterium]
MIKKLLFIVLTSLLLTGCSANLLKQQINYNQPFYKSPDSGKIAVITNFRIDLNGSESLRRNLESLQEAVADAIYSTGMYEKVIFGKEKIDESYQQIDKFQIEVVAKDRGKYNWWLAWPAIYPSTFFWPIQPYGGTIQVSYLVKYSSQDFATSRVISNEKEHKVVFYGFFRKSDVENKAIPLYYTGLDQLRDFVLSVNLEKKQAETLQTKTVERPVQKPKIQWQGSISNIAVLNLDAFGISEPEVRALTNRLSIELFNTGRFSILERNQMEEILQEQGFQQTGCTSSECAVEAGRLLNVEQMVTGSISKVGGIYSVEVRLIDVETGKIVAVGVEDIQGGIEEVLTPGMNKVVWNMLGRN